MHALSSFVALITLLAVAGCGCQRPPPEPETAPAVDAGAAVDSGAPGGCRFYGEPQMAGQVTSPELQEISGVVASRAQPGIFFVHNDSGDRARFFAIDGSGAVRGEYVLKGAVAEDWEDIDLGPCGDRVCVYLADIGDNLARRPTYTVFRVEEPVVPATPSPAPIELDWVAQSFSYPDGSHDAETLLVHPLTGERYVITKTLAGPAGVYRLSDGAATAARVGQLKPPEGFFALFTAGNLHPDGSRLLLRSYGAVWELRGGESTSLEALLGAPFRQAPSPDELQGEAISYDHDGRSYVTLAEGRNPVFFRVGCR